MRVLATLLLSALALAAPRAGAVALAFSSPGPGDVPGIVRVDMWFEDPTRSVDLLAIQFDIEIVGSSGLAPGFQLPSVRRGDEWPLVKVPFDLNEVIQDPSGENDVRVILAASDLFDVDSLAALAAGHPHCTGEACALQDAGLEADRVYLGTFNLEYGGGPVFLALGPVFGCGTYWCEGVDEVVFALRLASSRPPYCDDPRGCRIEGLAPEPSLLVPLSVAFALFVIIRARPWRAAES